MISPMNRLRDRLSAKILIALSLCCISLGLRWRPRFDVVLVFALFAGPVLDFLGMWLTKFVADGFAYLTLLGGWLMAAAYLIVAVTAIWQIWFETRDSAPKRNAG